MKVLVRIKVLHTGADNIGHGGRSTIAFNLAISMDESVVQNDFLAFKNIDKEYKDKIEELGNEIVRVKNTSKNPFVRKIKTLVEVVKRIENRGYTVVHIHADDALEAMKVIVLAKIAKIPVIIVHAHSSGGERQRNNKLIRAITWICKKILNHEAYIKLAVTEPAARYMYDKLDKVEFIRDGINVKKYSFDKKVRRKLRNEFELADSLVIGNVARFSPVKNHLFLIDVFSEIVNKTPHAKLLLVGEGDLKQDVQKYAFNKGVAEKVQFLGNRKDVEKILQAIDVFVLPSLHEGLGLVNIEAQASGLTCFVSNGVPKEAKILDSFTFLDLNMGAQKWAEKIQKFKVCNRQYAGQQVASAGYDINISANKVQEIYVKSSKKSVDID